MVMIQTPILLIYFNRPDILKKNLISLSEIKPANLFLACDGPRTSSNDIALIGECKQLIAEYTTWDCQIKELNSCRNNGCDKFVPMSINWFFDHVESGIILEDDCLISEEFYRFSTCLLEKYKDEKRIMNISATNFQYRKWGDGDYYFSYYPVNWGWATWRRAWKCYDSKMIGLEIFLSPTGVFNKLDLTRQERCFWKKFFLGLKTDKYTYWDAKWVYAIWSNNGISITPNFNLSTNIGYGQDATHTTKKDNKHELSIEKLNEQIKILNQIHVERKADLYLFNYLYKPKLKLQIKSMLKKISSYFR